MHDPRNAGLHDSSEKFSRIPTAIKDMAKGAAHAIGQAAHDIGALDKNGPPLVQGVLGLAKITLSPLALINPELAASGKIAYKISSESETTVYRAFGGDARAQGFSWTTENPTTVKDFRNLAGLPSGGASGANNTADFMVTGRVNVDNIITTRSALPLDGNAGGLLELIIDPKNVNLIGFGVLKP